jgi:hypothetical protein
VSSPSSSCFVFLSLLNVDFLASKKQASRVYDIIF